MKRTLVLIDYVSGHYLEYLHHLYVAAGERTYEEFVFAVPISFTAVSGNFVWPSHSNINLYYINESQVKKLNRSLLKQSYYYSKLLKELSAKFDVTHIFSLTLIRSLPFLPFFLGKKCKVSGIVYQIYIYRWNQSSMLQKVLDILKYLLFTHSKTYEKIYILNDQLAPYYFNRIYNTHKFYYLPDPVMPIDGLNIYDMHKDLNIGFNKKIVLHFGSLSDRKGTLEILEAIRFMSDKQSDNYAFIFAGQVQNDIKKLFYKMYNNIKNKVQIIVFDKYCSFDFIGSLCYTCDIILCPYKTASQSSGVIGYAAQFNKPVIISKNGLLGKLVKYYRLGFLIENNTAQEIIDAIEKVKSMEQKNNYLETHSVSRFVNAIM